jgi:hypothetical protein
LSVLQRDGVAAWLRAWRALPTVPPPHSPVDRRGAPLAGADRLVETLASMALGCLAAGG